MRTLSRLVFLVLIALLVAAGPAAAGSAHADDAGDSPEERYAAEQALAERFAPVMMLVTQDSACGEGEPFQPSDVSRLFDNPDIALRGPWDKDDLVEVGPDAETLSQGLLGYELDLPGNPLQPGCDYEKWADRVWEDSEPTIYARVLTQKGVTDRIALQYAFYYPFNDYNNKHESDWERIQLEFAAPDAAAAIDQEPVGVVYAQHYGSEGAEWGGDKLEIFDDTHPVVYVSAGSHASQYSAAVFLGRTDKQGFGCDDTTGPHDAVRPVVETIPTDEELAAELYPWATYEGHWGEKGPKRFYQGPTGPNKKQAWTKPFTWSDNARDRSYPLPGDAVSDDSATGFFCAAIARGSDAYRGFVDRPGRALGILALALALVLLLLRPTTWDEVPSVPRRARRTAGQVLSVSARSLVDHAPSILWLALPSAAASVLATLAHAQRAQSDGGADGVLWVVLAWLGSALLVVSLVHSQLGTAQLLDDRDRGVDRGLVDLSRRAAARLPAALVTLGLWVVAFVVLSLTVWLLPVVVVLFWFWSLVLPVVQLEGRWGPAALLASMRLVRPQAGTVAVLLVVSGLLVTFLGGAVSTAVLVAAQAPFELVNLVPGVVTTLVWPFIALLTTYAYLSGEVLTSQAAAGPEVSSEPAPADHA